MKKFFLLILILINMKLSLYGLNNYFINPISLNLSNSYYVYKLMHNNYVRYILLEDSTLTAIAQKKQPFDENIEKIMTKSVYDSLYNKFQYDKFKSIIYVKIINQHIDVNDPNLIYIDFFIVQRLIHENKYDVNYYFTFDQIVALRNTDNSWKLIQYEQPTKYHEDRVFFSYWSNLEYNYANEINYQVFTEINKLNEAYSNDNKKNVYIHLKNIVELLFNYYF